MQWRFALTIVVGLGGLGGRSDADPASSANAAKQAEAFALAGDFLNAAAKYRAAYAADPKPELICNVGVAYYKAKDLSRAQFYLSRCLERGTATLDAGFTVSVRAVMGSVENSLRTGDFTPVDIVVEPKGAAVAISGFGGDEGFVGSRVIWLPFGTHKITASYEGYQALTVEVEARTHTTTAAPLTLAKGASVPIERPRPTHVVDGPARSKLPALAVTAGSVAAIVVAGLAYHVGHQRAGLARFALTPAVYADDRKAVDDWNRMMAISGALAIAGASVSGLLWYRAFHTESRVELDASASQATLTFGRSW